MLLLDERDVKERTTPIHEALIFRSFNRDQAQIYSSRLMRRGT
jgi:hypothetical protein